MAGKVVHVEIGAADADRAQGFWSGVFGWEVGPPMSPEVDYRMFQTAEDQGGAIVGGKEPGPLTVYFDTPDIDASIAKVRAAGAVIAAGENAAGRATRRRCRATAGSPPAATPKGTRSASGREANLRRSYVPRRSRTRSDFPSLRGIDPGRRISTCAVSPSTVCRCFRTDAASAVPST